MTANKPGDPTTLNRLYGRSVGKPLRKGQQALVDELLPRIAVPLEGPVTSELLFGDARPLHFEIGFGGGEHLAGRADMLPDHGFIGAEPFLNGVAQALVHVDGGAEGRMGGAGVPLGNIQALLGHERQRHQLGEGCGDPDRAGGDHVLLNERRRDLQGRGNVIETLLGVIEGQHFGTNDLDGEQIANRVFVFLAIQTVQHDLVGVAGADEGACAAGLAGELGEIGRAHV